MSNIIKLSNRNDNPQFETPKEFFDRVLESMPEANKFIIVGIDPKTDNCKLEGKGVNVKDIVYYFTALQRHILGNTYE